MDSVTTTKFSWGRLFTGTGAVVGLVAALVGIAGPINGMLQTRHPLNGTFTLKTQTENSTAQDYKGMELTYTLHLSCDGTHITGRGEKIGEQLAGKSYTQYPVKARTLIVIDGNLNGDSLDAVFTEAGEIRKTSGELVLKWNGTSKSWFGTFDSLAATSSGTASLSASTD